MSNKENTQLAYLLRLVEKEDQHLLAVRDRFFPPEERISEKWLEDALSIPDGIDRLESFGAKFGRMQDNIVDKLLPRLLQAAGEIPGTAIDNLNQAERFDWIADANGWLGVRRLRNRLVHEYIDSPVEMLEALRQAREFVAELSNTRLAMAEYSRHHL